MEHSCFKCGHVMDEGRPFCPHCAAPQIRVMISEPVLAGLPAGESAAVAQNPAALPASQTVPVLAVPMQWSEALKPCALATGIATLLMFLGLTPLVAMFSVGFLAVIFYRQGHPGAPIKAAQGARLGALGGLLSFAVIALLFAGAATMPDLRAKIQQQIIDNAQKWAVSHPADAQVQAALEQMKSPESFVMMLIFGGVLLLVMSIVLGILGGALGGSILGRGDRS